MLIYELLTGDPPFSGKNQEELFKNILDYKISWPKTFPEKAKDLVIKLLQIDPNDRINEDEILAHSWF